MDTILKEGNIDVVSIVTPNNTHAPLALQCLRAGKHVVVEKPMCITTADATTMIEEAKKANVMLSVFQNRRYDGNYLAIKEAVDKGMIGDVFHIEFTGGGYGYPAHTWRQNKEVSGGSLYCDIGPHAVDFVLNLVPSKMVSVTGFFHKLIRQEVTNEDQARAIILFENGAVADIIRSHISYIGKPLWRIIGTKGSIVDTGAGAIKGYPFAMVGPSGGSFKMVRAECFGDEKEGRLVEDDVPYKESTWGMYYVRVLLKHIKKHSIFY